VSHSDTETDSVRLLEWMHEQFCLKSTSELEHWCGRTDRSRQSIPHGCCLWLKRPFTDGGAICPWHHQFSRWCRAVYKTKNNLQTNAVKNSDLTTIRGMINK